jgi:dihydrodipicolinate synthase/N-acetylneuraminate lyase
MGTWATLLLPINLDDSIDYIRLGEEIDVLIASGVDGIYSNGTAGEFYAQSEDEFNRIQGLLAEKCEQAGLPFQIGASHTSAQVMLERLRRAVTLRPSAVQVILPDWYPPAMDEILKFFERLATVADGVGLVLYNPPHAKRILSPEELGKLRREVPSLVGIKVAGGDPAWYVSMREQVPGLSVFVAGHQLASGFAQGAAGAYSNVACLQPRGAQRWYQQMKNDLPGAIELEQRIGAFLEEFIMPFKRDQEYSNQALDKLLAGIGGWAPVGTRLKWPYRWVPEEDVAPLRHVAPRKLPELFAETG